VHTHEHGDHAHAHPHDHGDHSGYHTGTQRIDVLEAIFAENDVRAGFNRNAFEDNRVRAINLMSSPGSGKTTVLQATLDELAGEIAVGVIEGDIATDLDAAKLGGRGARYPYSTPATDSAANVISTRPWSTARYRDWIWTASTW